MKTFEEKLRDYARLIIEVGINVQEGSPLNISVPVDSAEFGRLLAEQAYKNGASDVYINWYDDKLTRMKFENAPLEVFEDFPQWIVDRARFYGERGAGSISVVSTDPELLKGIDLEKIETDNRVSSIAMQDVRKYSMNDINSWCVVAIPSKTWAKKVFPELEGEEAVMALWEAIFDATRINETDPVEAWRQHLADLDKRQKFLNDKNFDRLRYRAGNGSNFTIGLAKNHIWMSGSSLNSHGDEFVANMPTEEVFTAPDNRRLDGRVVSSKPLVYGGNIIDKFEFTFEAGKVVDYSAKVGQEYLEDMLSTDENSKRLGEVALVPYDSPISNSNILFFNTLFDENASCHLAFGNAYPTNIEGGTNMTREELAENGINESLIHEDFMVGTEDLEIIGITEDGEEVKIFENGNWAF